MKKIVVFILLICVSCQKDNQLQKNLTSGQVFGTYYNIQFFDTKPVDFSKQYDSLFAVINKSMSTYIPTSDISKINSNDTTIVVDHHFKKVYSLSKEIYQTTNGFFDPTIGVLVNAWDFGPEGKIVGLDSLKVDSLLNYVGFDKVALVSNKIKKHPHTYIDFNAIGKGYGLDVISDFLDSKGYNNYLIDIGGEIVARGTNLLRQKDWSIGIEKPNFDGSQSQQTAVALHDQAMATSGVYRKFKTDDNGKRYAHIIDTKTGYPSKTNILSVSVIAPTCAVADAYATAFKAMGINKVKEVLIQHPELKVYFIYEDDNNQLQTMALNNFPE
ncbi:MAG: FAD:protein FMN transferase [Flavobacteriaceae bacterium]